MNRSRSRQTESWVRRCDPGGVTVFYLEPSAQLRLCQRGGGTGGRTDTGPSGCERIPLLCLPLGGPRQPCRASSFFQTWVSVASACSTPGLVIGLVRPAGGGRRSVGGHWESCRAWLR